MKEFRILKIERKYLKDGFAYAEKLLSTYAAEGWRVVSVAPDLSADIRGELLVTLERERP